MIESKYILDILEGIIEGEPYTELLRMQISYLSIKEYEYTGTGVFVDFNYSPDIYKFIVENPTAVILDGLYIYSPELTEGIESAGGVALLRVKEGVIDYLEIWYYSSDARKDLDHYTLVQEWMKYR